MPEVLNANLTLTESEGDVTINVRFAPLFNRFEKELGEMGCEYHSHVEILGMDPAGSLTGTVIPAAQFPQVVFPVNNDLPFVPSFNESITVPRSSLQEDTGATDDDELRARIRIHTKLPPEFTDPVFTDQEVLTDD
jgi:hypothetical protein